MTEDEREAAAIGEKKTEIRAPLTRSSITSEADFVNAVLAMRDRLDEDPPLHPFDDDEGEINEANSVIYKHALLQLHNELRSQYREADGIFQADLEASDIDDVEELGRTIAARHPASSAASIAARRYEQQLLVAERQREQDQKRWTLELWRDYYKQYRENADGYDFADAENRLQAAGWEQADKDKLKELFEKALEIENKISTLEGAVVDASSDDIIAIEADLDELQIIADGDELSSVAETKVLHNRLWMRYQGLRRVWITGIDRGIVEEVRDEMLPDEFKQYELYIAALVKLREKLDQLRESLTIPNTAQIVYLQKRLNIVKDSAGFLEDLEVMESPGFARLETLHLRVVEEAETLLSIQTDESESIFTKDVDWWMFTHHGDQWRATQKLWAKYTPDRADALSYADRREAQELLDYFSIQIANLDDLDSGDEKDVAEYHRFLALDIQINRLQEVLDNSPRAEVVVETPIDATSFSDHEMPSWWENPKLNTAPGWQQAYTEAAEIHGPAFLRSQAKYVTSLSEGRKIQDKSFHETFDDEPQYEGLEHAMAHYHGEDEDEIHELATFLKMREILFEAQASPNHGLSMTCDMDQLPDWEANGVKNDLFDYFTLDDNEAMKSHEKKYKYSHQLKKLVQRLVEILYENPITHNPPEPGDFKSREKGGKAFNDDGTPQIGWFGYYFWKDTEDNNEEIKKRMAYELTKEGGIAPGMSDEDAEEVAFFAHRVASLCGIRQDCFAPYMASGATPVDMLGDLSKYIGEVNLYAPELYSTYKRRIYLQLAEMIEIPDDWWKTLKGDPARNIPGHKKASDSRMDAVMRSYKASRLLCETMSDPLRDPLPIPIADDGVRIENTYYSMFDFYFNDEVRERRRDKNVTLKAWKRGKEEFVNFKQICFDTPKGIDVNNLDSLSEDELIKLLVAHVDLLINRGISYMKKNYDMVRWRDMGIMTRWAIDRCFRIYAKKDSSPSGRGARRLLKQIRASFDQAETALNAGKAYAEDLQKIIPGLDLDDNGVITGLDPNPAIRDEQVRDLEAGGVILSPKLKREGVMMVVDVPLFLKESYPDLTVVEFGGVYQDGKINLGQIKLKMPERTWDQMEIIMPSLDENGWIEKPTKRARYALLTNDLLSSNEYTRFKDTAKEGIFGLPPEKQQKDSEEDK